MAVAAESEVCIPFRPFDLRGVVIIPPDARGIVVLAHPRASSGSGPFHRLAARALNRAGIGTALVDLMTAEEERRSGGRGRSRFELDVIAGRLDVVADWLASEPATRELGLGYLGLGEGAVVALIGASERAGMVGAVVVAGRYPDRAGTALANVRTPTLFLVSQRDHAACDSNARAYAAIPAEDKRIEWVEAPRFVEPFLSGSAAPLAATWFERHGLGSPGRPWPWPSLEAGSSSSG
jgi:dienelactone hydrolase